MKGLIKVILFLCLLLSPNIMFGDDVKTVTISITNNKPQERPHAPNGQQIECTYADGSLTLSFKYPEGICELTVSEPISGENDSYTFDSSSETVIFIGELTEAHLLITTENGHSYQGDIY